MGQTRADISLVSAILAYIHCYLAAVGRPPIHVQNSSPLRAVPSFLSGGGGAGEGRFAAILSRYYGYVHIICSLAETYLLTHAINFS